ncbi:MAG: Gfo/Idh/MocA family oxidoreductase [Bacteroidia bacterium]|nr:Gfo/Idh/MocA family oxidoreductase [Bacteroidia bacterium]NNM15239.1 Gfo/Idh/MocA family oxidoreductase [Bacteroidia bacterium]
MGEKEKVKFAVVGVGKIGLRHAELITRNAEAELVACCDVKDSIDMEGTIPYFNTIDDLLKSDLDIDVINVCSPNGLHAEHCLKALNAEKHVVCEKPFALTKAECEKVLSKALQVSKHVFGVMQNRYSPPSVWMKDLVERQLLGDILMVQISCFWNRDDNYYKKGDWKGTMELDGGTLFTQFSHFVDTMYWLFGDIKNIEARFADFTHQHNTEFEDSGIVNFEFVEGKGMGSINYSTSVYERNFESTMTVIGKNGSVKIAGQYMDEVAYCNIKDYEMPKLESTNPANDYGKYKGSAANHSYIIKNVIDTLKNKTTVSTNALEGLKVVDIIERIYSLRKQ